MRLHGRRFEVVLPCGLRGVGDGPHRRATLVPLDGAAELLAADEPNPFLAAHHVLARCLSRLGPRLSPGLDDIRQLSPLDRDFLVVQLDRLSFGDVRYQTMRCPVPECQTRMDIELDLSTVIAPAPPDRHERELAVGEGLTLRVRSPSAGDQEALFEVPEAERASGMILRCLVGPPEQTTRWYQQLGVRERMATAFALGEATARLDLTLALECPKCGVGFSHEYDPVRGLLGRLRRSRADLLAEIHHIALHYHWSHSEILELPRSLRREYIELLERDASRGRGFAT